jgi:ParB-like chromosome segregation protein Spo0J
MKTTAEATPSAMSPKQRLAIEELEKQAQETQPSILPSRLLLTDIKLIPELFQPRNGKSEAHIEELAKALREHKELDSILVMQVGQWPVLIDGHHRWSAYKRTKGKHSIPVRYFSGTTAEAIAESGKENSKAKLPMQPSDRQDYSWRLTKMGMHSLNETARAAGVSKAQVAIMRKVLSKLGPQRASTYEVWMDAKRDAKRMDGDSGAVDEDWLHAQAQAYADRLYKEFGTKLSGNVEMFARAIELYMGAERVQEVIDRLTERGPDVVDDEENSLF